MNVDTGHLVQVNENELLPDSYIEIPESLNRAAKKKLNGKSEAYVSLTSNGKLSKWAKQKRKDKIAKMSRKQNR